TLPEPEDWLLEEVGGFTKDSTEDFQKRIRLFASLSPRAAALMFGALGPHLRKAYNRGDELYDLPLYPILLRAFLPHLHDLLKKNRVDHEEKTQINEETQRYAGALMNGLMIPADDMDEGWYILELYKTRFAGWSSVLAEEGIDLSDILAQIT